MFGRITNACNMCTNLSAAIAPLDVPYPDSRTTNGFFWNACVFTQHCWNNWENSTDFSCLLTGRSGPYHVKIKTTNFQHIYAHVITLILTVELYNFSESNGFGGKTNASPYRLGHHDASQYRCNLLVEPSPFNFQTLKPARHQLMHDKVVIQSQIFTYEMQSNER